MSPHPDLDNTHSESKNARRRAARTPAPVPVAIRTRVFPAVPPPKLRVSEPFPKRVVIAEAARGPGGRAVAGAYLGDGPDLEEVGGRFLGPAAPEGMDPPGAGPLRDLDGFLDRIIWRLTYKSRFGFVAWDPAEFFCSLAFTFRKRGRWAVVWTDLVGARRLVDYYRPPIVLDPLSNGRIRVSYGPRKHPDARDFDASGRQYPGRIACLQDDVCALVGERVEDLATACRLFDVDPPPAGPATVETLAVRTAALRELCRAVRAEAESWPGVVLDHLRSAAGLVSGAYASARIPQPLLRDRRSMHVPPRAIGAGMEAASIGARTGLFLRRVDSPGIDVDITACYPVGAALGGVQDFLTEEVAAHRLHGHRSLAGRTRVVGDAVGRVLLRHPEGWRGLAFLAKVRPGGDVLTAHVELFGTEATVTVPIVAGSKDLWTTGFDLAAAAIEDLDRGGPGRVPEVAEAWTFTFGRRLRGLRPVSFPEGWTWDPRRPFGYRSRDGRTWGNLYLLLAAMRAETKTDPSLSRAERLLRRGMLKVAAVAGAFGMFAATTPTDAAPGTRHRVLTADVSLSLTTGTPERPGPWAFPPAAALVEGAGRLLLTLLMHEVVKCGGSLAQVDTDGGFILATPDGSSIEDGKGGVLPTLSYAQVQEVRDAFAPLGLWSGLPIVPDRIEGGRLVTGSRSPSLLKVERTMVAPDGSLPGHRCYAPSLRRFAIHPADGSVLGPWRVSENTIGVMVNPIALRPGEFARQCYCYLLARDGVDAFDADWLDDPVLWPKTFTRPDDLALARQAIPDLRPTETVVYVRQLFGSSSYIARMVPGASWRGLDWRTGSGQSVHLDPAKDTLAGALRTWRVFLNRFLDHPVAFSLDAQGRRAHGSTRGLLHPAPILLLGATLTGRTAWADGTQADTLVPDPEEWTRILDGLSNVSGAELESGGLAPRTARAMRAGRRPVRRNAEAARHLVANRARAAAGLARDRAGRCLAPGCPERLTGRQRSFCARHARYPGSRRRAWLEAAGR